MIGSQTLRTPFDAAVAQAPGRATPWALRFTLAAMLVYVGRIGDIFPALAPLQLGKILIALAVLALILEGGGWRAGLTREPIFRPYLATLALIVLTAPFGIWVTNTLDFIVQNFAKEVVFVFLLAFSIRRQVDIRLVIWAFAGNALLLDVALFKYGPLGLEEIALGRNEIAMTSVMAVALLLPMKTEGLAKVLKWGLIAVMAFAVLKSASRGGYLGLASVGAVYAYFTMGKKVALASVFVMGIGGLIYTQLPSDFRGTADSIINFDEDYNVHARDGRIEIWKRGLQMVVSNPLTGVGFHNFPVAEGLMHRNVQGQAWMNAHNSPLQVAAEIGLLGLLAWGFIVKRMYRTARALRENQTADHSSQTFAPFRERLPAQPERPALAAPPVMRLAPEGARLSRPAVASPQASATSAARGPMPGALTHRLSDIGSSLSLALVAYLVCGFFLHFGFHLVFYTIMVLTLAAKRIAEQPLEEGSHVLSR